MKATTKATFSARIERADNAIDLIQIATEIGARADAHHMLPCDAERLLAIVDERIAEILNL